MKSLVLVSKQGKQYKVTVPELKPSLKSVYIFAFARSGSTLLNNMVAAYCQYISVPRFSLFNSAIDQGVPTEDIREDATDCFKRTGYIYTGSRYSPIFDIAKHFDVIPDVENENEHIRQVHPGNHAKKLKSDTIRELNKTMSAFLKYFDYDH